MPNGKKDCLGIVYPSQENLSCIWLLSQSRFAMLVNILWSEAFLLSGTGELPGRCSGRVQKWSEQWELFGLRIVTHIPNVESDPLQEITWFSQNVRFSFGRRSHWVLGPSRGGEFPDTNNLCLIEIEDLWWRAKLKANPDYVARRLLSRDPARKLQSNQP